MRADAQRNRDHILEVAAELFASRGATVPVDEVARAADVGVGTLHRHFPTKDQLVEAVLVAACEPILASLDDALADADPARGLERFLLAVVRHQSRNRALVEEMREARDPASELAAVKDRIRTGVADLVIRAQRSGQVRADIAPGDLRMVFAGLAQTAMTTGEPVTGTQRERFVLVVLDGLLTPRPTPLPGTPPNL